VLYAVGEVTLTPRQTEILALAAKGLSNKEIGERLYLAIATVKFHLGDAYDALQARNRAHAVALAIRIGLIE